MKVRGLLGFTIMELLVVLAIIGILVAVVYGGFGDARSQARDKTMMSDIKQLQLALELHKAQYNSYPASGLDALRIALVPTFIPKLPDVDNSANTSCSFTYNAISGNTSYKFTAANCHSATAAAQGIQAANEFARCPSSCGTCAGSTFNAAYRSTAAFYQTMAIYSLGSECN